MGKHKGPMAIGEKHYAWTCKGEEILETRPNGKTRKTALFQCDCGTEKRIPYAMVRHGRTTKCYECHPYKNGGAPSRKQQLTPEQLERKRYVNRLWPNW